MAKRRENDPKRKIDFEKMGKALGFYSYDTDLGSRKLFSNEPGETVHRTTYGKGKMVDPGKGHVKLLGPRLSPDSELREFPSTSAIEGVAGISKKKEK